MRHGVLWKPLFGALLMALGWWGCSSQPTQAPINTCLQKEDIPQRPMPKEVKGPILSQENPTASLRAGSVDEDNGDTVRLRIPDGASSVALMVEGTGDNIVVAASILSPSGQLVWDFMQDVSFNKTGPDDDPYTLLLPSTPEVTLEGGDWYLRFITDNPDGAQIKTRAFFKEGQSDTGTLDVNLFFVGVEGLNAELAQKDEAFQQIITNVENIFKSAGVSFGEVAYIDADEESSERLGVTTTYNGELRDLFKLSEGQDERKLNFFFVSDLEGESSGFSLLGISGGVPGPPGVQGTGKSGVAVNMTGYRDDPAGIEVVMAHEAGHYLGLFHTTERNGSGLDPDGITGYDPLCDTLSCQDSYDANGNLVLSAKECVERDGVNLMFSLATTKSRKLTAGQGQILRSNYLVK